MSEVEKITMDEARELVADPVLWPKIRDFLWDFAPQVHASWLAHVSGHETRDARREADASLVARLSSSPRVKRFILSSLGVEPCFHTFPKDDWSRLLLLDGPALESIAKWLGALACADALRRVTGGAAVRELKAGLAGVYPEVFGYTEYFRKLKVEKLKVENLISESVVLIGTGMLLSVMANLPPSLVLRLKFKLPSSLVSRLPDEGHGPPDEMRAAELKKRLKLKVPEAYKICC